MSNKGFFVKQPVGGWETGFKVINFWLEWSYYGIEKWSYCGILNPQNLILSILDKSWKFNLQCITIITYTIY